MKKVSVTYHAPKGDSKVTEAFGHTFYDGKAEDVEVEDHVVAKLQSNRNFECGKPSDVEQKRDPAKEKAAADAAKKEDDAKRTAQDVPGRVLRGDVHPNLPGEGDDKPADKSADKAQAR